MGSTAFRVVLATAVAVCSGGGAWAFGPTGHEVTGAIADGLLTPAAAAQVKALIGMPLRTAATWADCAKDVSPVAGKGFVYQPDPRYSASCKAFQTPAGIARMQDYVKRNWNACDPAAHVSACHKLYHFADVAIEHDHYDRSYAGTSDHDVVSAIGAAVLVLQGKPAPAPISLKDRQDALLLLAHLVGDVHQPLHVGSVYLDAQNHLVDPGAAGHPVDKKTDTHGGNAIEDKSNNLHAEWDEVDRKLDPLKLTPELLAAARAVPASAGDPAGWPSAWPRSTTSSASSTCPGGCGSSRSGGSCR